MESKTDTNPQMESETGTHPNMESKTGTNPQMESETDTNPQMESKTETNPKMESETGTNPQMEFEMEDGIPTRRGLILRPDHTTVVFHAGYSVLCEIEGRPGVVLKVPLPFSEYAEAMEIEKRAYARLGKHPNIVNVIEMNEWGSTLMSANFR
jgi:hypothetical protein